MHTEAKAEKEFIIPTTFKSQIGSLLSWPAGAKGLTKAVCHVPQVNELQLRFCGIGSKQGQGKLPTTCWVIEARYLSQRTQDSPVAGFNDASWCLNVYAVPRSMRAEIRDALQMSGLAVIASWLVDHAGLSKREGHLSIKGVWNSESRSLIFDSRDDVLPEISSDRQRIHR